MEDYEISELKRRLAGLLEERQMWRRTHGTLTDEEREAIESAADFIDSKSYASSATLRSLLDRNGAVSGRETVHLSERDRDLLRFAANTIGDADCSALFRRLLKDLP